MSDDSLPGFRPMALHALLIDALAAPESAVPIMIWGAPGIGKSAIVRQAAAACGVPVIDLRLSQLEPTDLRGIPVHEQGRVRWVPPDELPQAERDGARGVLFLDEINAAPPPVAASAYQLILDRRLGAYALPPGWILVAAGNRLSDHGITFVMPAPLANRFMHLSLVVAVEQWLDWAQSAGIDQRIQAFVRAEPQWLSVFPADADTVAFPSPRSWAFASRMLAAHEDWSDSAEALVAGCVGKQAAAALAQWVAGTGAVRRWLTDENAFPAGMPLEAQIEASRAILSAVRAGSLSLAEALALAERLPEPPLAFGLVEQLHELAGDRLFDEPAFSAWVAARGDQLPPGMEG
ncbi:AAA family ATPase [Halothiobacillus sp. DCM-1]|uniref:AAA family ATPase n=1 Tax=Halothiobacillus sp. DCM-1 TaxID=3112558 RepID=UPI003255DEFE